MLKCTQFNCSSSGRQWELPIPACFNIGRELLTLGRRFQPSNALVLVRHSIPSKWCPRIPLSVILSTRIARQVGNLASSHFRRIVVLFVLLPIQMLQRLHEELKRLGQVLNERNQEPEK